MQPLCSLYKTEKGYFAVITRIITHTHTCLPCRISIRVGNHVGDLIELTEVELHEPMGWTSLPLKWPNGAPVSLFTMQLCVLANHQNGRDTHLRGIRLFSPARHTGLEVHPSLFTKPEGRMFATIR